MFSPRVLIGCLLSFFFLVGRWTLARVGAEANSDWCYEPRFWALFILGTIILLDQPLPGYSPLKRLGQQPKLGLYTLGALALFSYLIESANWSPSERLGQDKAYEMTLVIATVVLLFLALRQGHGDAIRTEFWKATVLLTGLMAVLALANTATERLAILGGGPNTFGRNMGFLVLGTMYMSRRSGPQWLGVWWALAALGMLLLLLSGSRGAMAAAAAAACVYQVIDRQKISKRLFMFLGASLVGAVLLTQTEYGRKAQEAFAYRVLYLTFEQQYSSGRTELYAQAYEMGMDNPVFGVGLNGYRYYVGIYPHNLFLETFAEGGTIGLLLLALPLLGGAIGLLSLRGRLNTVAVAAAAHAFTSAQFSGDLYDSRGIFLLIAFALVPEVTPARQKPRQLQAGGAGFLLVPHLTRSPATSQSSATGRDPIAARAPGHDRAANPPVADGSRHPFEDTSPGRSSTS